MDLISINSIIAEKGQNCDDQGESVLWLDSSEDGAGTGDRIDGAGIVGKARIDADGHVLDRAGAAVDPRPCAVPVPGRLRRGGQAEALEIGIGEARHGAAAVPAAGREVGLPEGVVVAQNGAVPAPVPGPGPVIEGGDVAQPGTAMGEAGDLRPFAGRHGDAQIGIEDGSEPPRRAQLDRPGRAGQGVRPDLAAPPAPGAQDGLKFIPESLEGRAFGQRAVHGLTDIGEDVEAGDLGDGEGAGVFGGGVRCASHSRYACLWRGRTPPPPAAGRRGFRGRDQPSSGFPPSSPCCAPSVEIHGDAATRRRGGAGKPRGEGIGVHGVEGLRAIKRGAQGVMAVGRVDGPAQRGARGTAARLRHAPVDQTAP